MKTVIFMRHGKAGDHFEFESDFERPLVSRGKTEVREAAEKLKTQGIVPDTVICSPAFRTAVTARIAAHVFEFDTQKIQYISALYMGHNSDYLQALSQANGKVILLAGHNPATGNLAMHFSNGKINSYPTSSVAVFRFKNDHISFTDKPELLFFDLRK